MGLAVLASTTTTLCIILTFRTTEVSGLLWRTQLGSSGYGTGPAYGNYYGSNTGVRYNRGDLGGSGTWGGYSRYNDWSNSGWNNNGYNKGWNSRECYDSSQCRQGECCRYRSYGRAQCEYVGYGNAYGCIGRRPDDWRQPRPVYPQNHKGGQPPPYPGRAGFCPPQGQTQQSPTLPCLRDDDCPRLMKCCPSYKQNICMNPVYT